MGWLWLIVAARLAAAVLLFACTLPLHLLLSAFGGRTIVPPHFLRAIGWIFGLRVRHAGRPAAERGPLLLIANHASWLDILVMAGSARVAFVAHDGLAQHPMIRWLCKQNETLFVTREQRGTVGGQVERLREALGHRRMAIFAEGTTSDGTRLLPFKSALLSAVEGAAVTVQPVALDYVDAAEIAWRGDEPAAANVLRMLARLRPIRVTVRFLPSLAGAERAGRKAMARSAQQRIAAALDLPVALPNSGPIA